MSWVRYINKSMFKYIVAHSMTLKLHNQDMFHMYFLSEKKIKQ